MKFHYVESDIKNGADQKRQVGTLWHLTAMVTAMVDVCVCVGVLDNVGECNKHIVFHVKPS